MNNNDIYVPPLFTFLPSPLMTTKRNHITTACQHCRRRKAKCTGQPECERCARLGIKCQFTFPTKKRGPPKKNQDFIESTLNRFQKTTFRNDFINVSTLSYENKNVDLVSHDSGRNSAFCSNDNDPLLMINCAFPQNGIHLKEA